MQSGLSLPAHTWQPGCGVCRFFGAQPALKERRHRPGSTTFDENHQLAIAQEHFEQMLEKLTAILRYAPGRTEIAGNH